MDEVYELYVKLLPGHDYCAIQIWATPISDDHRAPFDRVQEILDGWLPEQLDGQILKGTTPFFSLKVYSCQEVIPPEEITSLFADDTNVVRSRLYSNRLQLTADRKGRREKYLVTPTNGMVPNQLMSNIVDGICRVETYFNKIISFYDVYPEIYAKLEGVEEEIVSQMDEISVRLGEADAEALRAWLVRIGQKYGHLSLISRGLRQDSFSLHSNLSNMRSTLRAWDEERVSNYLPISDLLLKDAEMVSSAYDGLSERIQGIQEQLGNMIAMVRARIELGQQEQSLQQLTDLVRMEKSMDVLEFIFLAAILLEISGFIFAGLGEIWGVGGTSGIGFHHIVTHLWQYPALLTALFVPVILVLSYFIIKLIERLIA